MSLSELIVLPPLAHDFQAQMALDGGSVAAQHMVYVLSESTRSASSTSTSTLNLTLEQALQQYPKAPIAFHPVDAPLYTLTLPPLPVKRREAALKVKLEDLILNDPSHLALAVHALGQHRFSVATVPQMLLKALQAVLLSQGHAQRRVLALSGSLPIAGEWLFHGWTFWRDEHNAGAMPAIPTRSQSVIASASSSAEAVATSNLPVIPTLTLANLNLNLNLNSALVFKTTIQQGSWWQRWRLSLGLLGLCAGIWFAGVLFAWRQGLAQERQIQAEINAAFQAALPNTPIKNPVLQLQAALGIHANTTTEAAPPTLIHALSQIPSDWPKGAILSLEWQAPHLSITVNSKLLALDVAQKNTLTQSLAAQQITIIW